jgi:hypothetical protein
LDAEKACCNGTVDACGVCNGDGTACEAHIQITVYITPPNGVATCTDTDFDDNVSWCAGMAGDFCAAFRVAMVPPGPDSAVTAAAVNGTVQCSAAPAPAGSRRLIAVAVLFDLTGKQSLFSDVAIAGLGAAQIPSTPATSAAR